MRKILVCGSAGFLMSNLMRYMLYRTKDYEFASLDRLESEDDHRRRVYLHKRHKFYMGDAGDQGFVEKLIWIEDPDIVVVGTGAGTQPMSNTAAVSGIIMPTATICDLQSVGRPRRIIQLVPNVGALEYQHRAVWNNVESMILGAGGTILRLPRCFGRRGHGSFEMALQKIVLGQHKDGWEPDRTRHWYAYAEDVASMIWFLIENPDHRIARMPALGYVSPFDMVAMSSCVHGWQCIISDGMLGKEESTVHGWMPDSKDIEEAVCKTVQWYMMNKWFFYEKLL